MTNRNATSEQQKEHKKESGVRQAVERTISIAVTFLRKNRSPFHGKEKLVLG